MDIQPSSFKQFKPKALLKVFNLTPQTLLNPNKSSIRTLRSRALEAQVNPKIHTVHLQG